MKNIELAKDVGECMKVLVTGGTGFTGSRLIPLLLQNGFQVRALTRSTSDRSPLSALTVEWATGDLSNPETLTAALRGVDALVNIASLGFGHAESIVRSAKEAGVKRGIFISTTAIFTQLNAGSKSIRLAAEEAIQASGLDYTILRPTMIYGSPRDRNMWRLIRLLRMTLLSCPSSATVNLCNNLSLWTMLRKLCCLL